MSGRASAKAGCQRSSLQFNCLWQGQNLWVLMRAPPARFSPVDTGASHFHFPPLWPTTCPYTSCFCFTFPLSPYTLTPATVAYAAVPLSRLVPGLGPQCLAAPSLWNAHNSLLHLFQVSIDTYPSAPQRSSCLQINLSKNPNSRIKPRSPALQADSLPAELPGKPTFDSSMFERNKIIFL